MISMSIVLLMYAEHVLRVAVDWLILPFTGFGCLLEIYLKMKPTQIAYMAVLDWFKNNPTLVDDPESRSPTNRKSWSWSRFKKGDDFLLTMSWIEILELHLPKWT